MSVVSVSKWGASSTVGTSGGTVTWSIIPAGTGLDSAGFTRSDTTSDLVAALPNDYLAQIARAFDAWSAVANVRFLAIEDQGGSAGYRGSGRMADIRIGGATIDGPHGTLAFAVEPGIGDIVFDTDEAWTSDLLFRAALHEIGHAIGLGHVDPSVATAIMNPFLSDLDALQPHDIADAQTLYGAAIDPGASSASWHYILPDDVADLSLLEGAPVADGPVLWGNGLANRMTGDQSGNFISGLGGDDQLYGRAGDDTLDGGDGNDLLAGGPGADVLIGAAGGDTASYADAASGVDVRLIAGQGFAGDARGDSLRDVENLSGSEFGDLLQGDNGANALIGGSGNDNLNGLAGDDLLIGGAGDDLLFGGAGADDLYGGAGVDTASYTNTDARLDARLITGRGYAGDARGDSFTDIENLFGGNFDDVLQGDNGTNVLLGGGGNDNLNGLAGDDALNGGDGDDTLFGGAGGDDLNGGGGTDTASYTNATGGIDARLISGRGYAGDARGDRFSGIENLFGSRFDDLLQGDNGANVLLGGGGNDNLNGLAGDDALSGGAGNDAMFGCAGSDLLTGGAGNDLFVFRRGDGVDRITDFSAGAGLGDRILFDYGAASPNSFADVLAAAAQLDGNTTIDLGGGDAVILLGVKVEALTADDFLF